MRREHNSTSTDQHDEYFWIKNEGTSAATLYLKRTGTLSDHVTVHYTTVNPNDAGGLLRWTKWASTDSPGTAITLNVGKTIYLKGNVTTFCSNGKALEWVGFDSNSTSNVIHIGGNLMSLFYGVNFQDNTEFDSNYSAHCVGMFYGFKGLVDASKLIMPAKTLTKWSYGHMFQSSQQLKYPPIIEMNDIQAASACKYMFYGCSALLETPKLYPTTHNSKQYCYDYMFQNCSSLKTIYIHMLTWGSNNRSVFSGVASSGTIYMRSDATWTPSSYNVPSAWTISKTL